MMLEKTMDEAQVWQVALKGDIDLYNAPELKEALLNIKGADIRLNCEQLEYIDSTGLGVLVSAMKAAKEEGHTITVAGLKPHIKRIFTLTNLHTIFVMEDTQA
ncbi:MAG: STAS domain-containing protein [Christensenellaceae bacterium]|nr:STAS domain-containing protein [Christensenellaceae bacterium]